MFPLAVAHDDNWDIERQSRYWIQEARPYYRVRLGDRLGGAVSDNDNDKRYRIEHKLGWGGYSTVWLAHDAKENRAVALKIMSDPFKRDREAKMHQYIKETVTDTPRLTLALDSFYEAGQDHAQHTVLVLPLAGPSLYSVASQEQELQNPMRVARDLLMALGELHDARIIHAGK